MCAEIAIEDLPLTPRTRTAEAGTQPKVSIRRKAREVATAILTNIETPLVLLVSNSLALSSRQIVYIQNAFVCACGSETGNQVQHPVDNA